jgi:hypothetical protein
MMGIEASGGTTQRGSSGMSNRPVQPASNTAQGDDTREADANARADANAPSVLEGRNAAAHVEGTRDNLIGATLMRSDLTFYQV